MDEGIYAFAIEDFRRARQRGNMRSILDRARGRSRELLSYEEVKQKLNARETPRRELQDIPLDAIVGSVGRYKDFTRDFMPRKDSDAGRWANVKVAMTGLVGVPPIEAFQVGEVYFVLDGNHRVSVARELDATHIQGYVRKVRTRVPIETTTQPVDLIGKAEYTEFLQRTRLDSQRPDSKLEITEVGRYRVLEDQIETYRRNLVDKTGEQQSTEQASGAWYDDVYLPLVKLIRERSMLRGFPGRTEADLYVWITQHEAALEDSLGWDIKPQTAAADLQEHVRDRSLRRLGSRLLGREMVASPERWRAGIFEGFGYPLDVLVALSGEPKSWSALEQAQNIAGREGARLLGLHVVRSEDIVNSERAQAVKAEYQGRCGDQPILCQMAIDVGDVAEVISKRARWTDLVVVHLAHPPMRRSGGKAGAGFQKLIRECPRPVLAVPRGASPMNRILLAYDGSAKSVEALYLATYFAGRWEVALSVVTVSNGDLGKELLLDQAGDYTASRGVQTHLVSASGDEASEILKAAEEERSDLLIMGGYGHSQIREIILGSTVDSVLGRAEIPILICR